MHAYLAKLDGAVGEFKAEQQSAELALKGAYLEFTGSANPTSALARKSLAATVQALTATYEKRALAVLSDRMLGAAHTGVVDASRELGDAWGADKLENAALNAREALRTGPLPKLSATVRASLQQAGQATLTAAHRFAIEVQRRKDGGRQERSAAIEVAETLKIQPKFEFMDTRGRRWNSTTHLATAVRQALLAARNEAFMGTLSDAGVMIFRVDHADSKDTVHNLPFTLSAGVVPGMATYDEIRDKVFHPNSRSIVAVAH